MGRVSAGIIPHHALVSPIIAGWFAGMSQQTRPTTIVVVGPDHQDRGVGYMTTAVTDWKTPDGALKVNRELVGSLRISGDVVIDPELIRSEHGVYTALPYIHRTWPAARVITIAVKSDDRPDRLARLAQHLDTALQPNDLVLATVDFSHDTAAVDALRADAISLDVIRRGDATAAFSIPVDSPPAISLLLTLAQRRALRFQQIAHTTSAQFTGILDAPSTTSYLSAYFWTTAR